MDVQERPFKDTVPPKGCVVCQNYSAFKETRAVEGMEGVFIYGFCFKEGTKSYGLGQGKGYPVYIESGGSCDSFKRRVDEPHKKPEKGEKRQWK